MDLAEIIEGITPPAEDTSDDGGETDAPNSEVVETPDVEGDGGTETETETETEDAPEDPFSDAALATKEGIAKAREAVRALQKKSNSKHVELSRRENRLKQRERAFNSEQINQSALYRRVNAELDTLRNGSADDIIGALGRLTGRNGAEVYREITDAAIANGKRPQPSRELVELRTQVQELTTALQKRFQTEKERALTAQEIEAEQRVIARFTAVDPETKAPAYPSLAHFSAQGREREILQYMINIREESADEEGRPTIDIATALGQIEAELRHMVPQRPVAAAAKADAGRATGASSRNPRIPAKRPLGSSISPTRSNVRASTRELTDEERLEELKRDPDFLAAFGIG